jgi:HSP20 family protein
MAEADMKRGSGETRNAPQQSGERSRQGGSLSRRGGFPSLFNLHPSELLNANPFALMRRFTDEMDRVFEGFGGLRSGEITQWSPPVEISEKDGKLEVSVELPGVKENEVKVEVTDEGLVIQGERKREHEEKREGYYRSERIYGQFYRLVPLPENANIDQARAEFRNGELHISVPVPEQQRRRREIPVSSGGERKQPGTEASTREQAKAKAG